MIAFVFFLAFALVYLAGFYALDTSQALAQWAKGMVKFVLHFGFLVTGVALARRSLAFYWLALAAFLGGIALNALYGVIQLTFAELVGANLDAALIEPITSRQTGINVFGAVGGTQEVFRPNALTGTPTTSGSSSSSRCWCSLRSISGSNGATVGVPRSPRSSSSCSSSSWPRSREAACSGSRAGRSSWRPTGGISGDPPSSFRSERSWRSSVR